MERKKKLCIFSLLSLEVFCSILYNLFEMRSFVKVKKVKNVFCYLNSLQLKVHRAGVNSQVTKIHL